jgi:hypothetical protein
VVTLVVFCTALNGAGFAWNLFEPVPLYDEVAHLLTPLVLVVIVAEIVYRDGGDDEFFNTRGMPSSRAASSASSERRRGRE